MRLFEDPQFLKKAAAISFGAAAAFAILTIILFFLFDIRGMIRAYREIRKIKGKTENGKTMKDGKNMKNRKISKSRPVSKNRKDGQNRKADRELTNDDPGKKINMILAVILTAALLPAWPLSSAAHTVSSAGSASGAQAAARAETRVFSAERQLGNDKEAPGNTRERTDVMNADEASTGASFERAEAGNSGEKSGPAETGNSGKKSDFAKAGDSGEKSDFGKTDNTSGGVTGAESAAENDPGNPQEIPTGNDPGNPQEIPAENDPGNPQGTPAENDPGNPKETPAENDPGNPKEIPAENDPGNPKETPAENDPGNYKGIPAENDPGNSKGTPAENDPGNLKETPKETMENGSEKLPESPAESATAEAEISGDGIPGIEVSMPLPTLVPEWPTWHRADNCAVSVKIRGRGISGYRIRIGDAVEVTSENVKDDWVRADEEGMTITVPPEEVCKNADGTVRISAQAVSQSGARTKILNVVGRYMTVERDAEGMITAACFELDTKSPAMEKVQASLKESGSSALRDLTRDDLRYRADTDAFYFAQEKVVLVCGIDEENYDTGLFSATGKKNGKSVEIPDSGDGGQGTFSIAMEDEAEYAGITIGGTDKAGNPLLSVPGEPGPQAGAREEDEGPGSGSEEDNRDALAGIPLCTAFSEAGEGRMAFLHGFTIDRTAPQILIEHRADPDGSAFLYSEKEADRLLTLYTNFQVSTEITITDRCGENASLLDGDSISAGGFRSRPDGSVTREEITGSWSHGSSDREFTGNFRPGNGEEGHYWFEVSMTDRAGNRPVVREVLKKERITDCREGRDPSQGETLEDGSAPGPASGAASGSIPDSAPGSGAGSIPDPDPVSASVLEDRPVRQDVESSFTIVCDCTPPELSLTFSTDAVSYLYRNRAGGSPEKEAYMNRPLTAEAKLLNEENHDRNRICFLLRFKGAGKEPEPVDDLSDGAEGQDRPQAVIGTGTGFERIPMDQESGQASRTIESDGRAVFFLFGTDKAGNPAAVTEQFLTQIEDRSGGSPEDAGPWKTSGCGDHYDPHLAFVVDTVSPEAEILYEIGKEDLWLYSERLVKTVAEAGGGAGPSVSAYGRGGFRPVVRIMEANELDEDRIRINEFRGKEPGALPGSPRALRITSAPSDNGVREAEGIRKLSGDSLYLFFAIAGEDRAGNPVRVTERFSDNEKARSGKQGGFKGSKVFSGSAGAGRAGEESGNTESTGEPAGTENTESTGEPAGTENTESTGETAGTENTGDTDTWYISRVLLIVDRVAPEAVLTCTPEKNDHEVFLYRERTADGGPEVTSYFNGEMTPSISVKEGNAVDPDRLEVLEYAGIDQLPRKGKKKALKGAEPDPQNGGGNPVYTAEGLTGLKKDGSMAYYVIRGTDRAGNPVAVTKDAIEGKAKIRKMGQETGTLSASASAAERRTDPQTQSYTSHFLFVIDRTPPRVCLTYRTKEMVYVYSRKNPANVSAEESGKASGKTSGKTSGESSGKASGKTSGKEGLYAFVSGTADIRAEVTNRKEHIDLSRLYYAVQGPGRENVKERQWTSGASGPDVTSVLLKRAETEGAYVCGIWGEDKAGNAIVVTESIDGRIADRTGDSAEGTAKGSGKQSAQLKRTVADCGKGYVPLYTLVIDRTGPLVTLEYAFSAAGAGNRPVTAYVYNENGKENKNEGENRNHKEGRDSEADRKNEKRGTGQEKPEGLSVYVSGRAQVTMTVSETYGDPERLFYTRTVEEDSGRGTSSRHTIGSLLADSSAGGFFETIGNGAGSFSKTGKNGTGSLSGSAGDGTGKVRTFRRTFRIDTISRDGRYCYGAMGTDCAGNPATVIEKFAGGTRLNTDHSGKAGGGSVKSTGRSKDYTSYYTIIIDTTAPEYRFAISLPPDPEEAFDGGKGKRITYYGKGSQSILAEYTVRERNYDGTRICSDYSSLPALRGGARVDDLEALSPGWTAPARTHTALRKGKNMTTAVFSMPVEVCGMNEGMYRFEIAGCDKAGNLLLPSPEQRKADASMALKDRIARTAEHGRGAGQYWSERKAVDVTPPTGVLKVQPGEKAAEAYYEMRFDIGGDDPVRCEPFRSEQEALVILESDDQSPTKVSFHLRSRDGAKDRAYRGQNPVLSPGTDAYGNDSSARAFVRGEQVFYIENILIRDRAGNARVNSPGSAFTLEKSAGIYLDVSAPELSRIGDAEAPRVRIIADGSFTRHEADGERYIYRPEGNTLNLKVSVTDPGGAKRSSGLGRVTVKVTAGDRDITDRVVLDKIPYTFPEGKGGGVSPDALVYSIEEAGIRIPTGAFAQSNDITVRVEARDNSGNRSDAAGGGGLVRLGIDTTGPKIEVNYTDDVRPRNGRYFSGKRMVQIAVIDRNVDRDRIHIRTNIDVPDSLQPPHGNRSGDGSGETGNGDRWTMTLTYDRDGEYTLAVDGSDALGNPAEDIVWNGPSPRDFVIDRTRPVLRLSLLNTDVKNGKYYRDVQTVGITVRERNFRQEDVQYISSSGSRGRDRRPGETSAPVFSASGDVHTGTVTYEEDGYYTVRARYVDLAGNTADEAVLEEFVVDRTAPELVLENIPSEGEIYTGAPFCPTLTVFDTYADVKNSVFEARKAGIRAPLHGICTEQRADLSLKLQMPEFTVRKAFDGVYYVTAFARDLAGNRSREQRIRFSVNRFGSSFEAGDPADGRGYADGSGNSVPGFDSRGSAAYRSSNGSDSSPTMAFLGRYFNSETKDPIVIREINPSPVVEYSVTMRKDSFQRVLQPGREYKRTVELDEEGKHSYLYEIFCPVFEKEGNYSFVISSRDRAGNDNSTAQVMQEESAGGKLSAGLFPIAFCVDRTPPVNRITGVRSDVQFIKGDELEIFICPEDGQTGVKTVELRFWKSPTAAGTDAAPEKVLKYRYYEETGTREPAHSDLSQDTGGKETPDPVHPDLRLYTGEKGIEIPVHLDGSDQWQILEIITTDAAGNESRDYRAAGSLQEEGREIRIRDSRRRFLISSDPLVRLRPFRLLFPAAGAAAALLLLLVRRRTGSGAGAAVS